MLFNVSIENCFFTIQKKRENCFFLKKVFDWISEISAKKKVFNLSSNLLLTSNGKSVRWGWKWRAAERHFSKTTTLSVWKFMEWKASRAWAGERENLIKLYVFALVFLAVIFAAIPPVVSYFCQFSSFFLFSAKVFYFGPQIFMQYWFLCCCVSRFWRSKFK